MILLALAIVVILFVLFPLLGLTLWALLSTIVVGLIIGALGRLVVPGRQRIGALSTVFAGLSGGILGGFLGAHVLSIGHVLTVLLEVGIAALVVVGVVSYQRRHEHSAPPSAGGPSWLSNDRHSSGSSWR